MVLFSFIAFLLLFTVVGLLAALQKQNTTDDYLIANRNVHPWLAALSAVATNNSGFMFIGLIGYTYRDGLSAVWMMIGWLSGDFLAWLFVHPRIRTESERVGVATIPTFLGTTLAPSISAANTSTAPLATSDPLNTTTGAAAPVSPPVRVDRVVIVLAGIITFLLLGTYAAAQLKAGSTALNVLFGWDLRSGAILGAVIVVLYCFAGGIRASIWTDCAQAIVMLISMALLLVMANRQVGGPAALWEQLAAQDAQLLHWMPRDLRFGFLLYFLGMVGGGFGAIGQPHILVRYMAIQSVAQIQSARRVYFAWFIPFFAAAIAVGLYARALLPDITAHAGTLGLSTASASELAMPALAGLLLPEVLVGLVLAGLFSATMSTADSQILICSGVLTQDISPRWRRSYFAAKVGTLAVTALALGIALFANQSVFSLVLIAWSAMGASIGPLIVLRVYHRPVPTFLAILMMLAGIGTVIAWQISGLDAALFKIVPGLLVAFAVYGVWWSWQQGSISSAPRTSPTISDRDRIDESIG